jgi:hypothetical protein
MRSTRTGVHKVKGSGPQIGVRLAAPYHVFTKHVRRQSSEEAFQDPVPS